MSAVVEILAGATVTVLPTEAEPVEKYRFDGFFQTKIASLALRDTHFVQRTDGLVRPEYFESSAEGTLVNIAITYYEKYRKIPADASIYATLIREAIANKTMKVEQAKIVGAHLRELFKVDVSDRDYVIDKVAEFARHQAVAAAMHESIHKLDKRDFESIAKLMKKALDVGAHIDIGAYDFDSMVDTRLGDRLDRAAGLAKPLGITTGYPGFNACLHHEGWGRRELSVIMGGAKAGKTTALMDFGVNAYGAGKNVLYVTLEVAASILAERMDANISQIAMKDLGAHAHDVRKRVREFIEETKKGVDSALTAKFIIHEFPSGSFMVRDLRRLIERYKGHGVMFDLVIVDYADLMAPERYTESSTENSKSVYVHLRGLAMAENFACLTATQTNRQGYTAAVARAEHVSEDFNKIRIADIVISINATDEERANKQARLFFVACRNQAGGYAVRIEQDIDRMKFISKVLGPE